MDKLNKFVGTLLLVDRKHKVLVDLFTSSLAVRPPPGGDFCPCSLPANAADEEARHGGNLTRTVFEQK